MLCVDTMRHQRARTHTIINVQAVTTNSRFTSQHASKLKMECRLEVGNPVYFCIRINSTKCGWKKIGKKMTCICALNINARENPFEKFEWVLSATRAKIVCTHACTHAQCRQVTETTAKLQVQIDFYCTTFSTTIPINHVGNEAHKLPIHEMVKKNGMPDTCHRRELIENYGFFPLHSNTNTRIHVTAAARIVFLSSLSWNSIRNLITIAIVTIFKLSRHFPCVHCAVARRNKKCVFPSFLRSIYQKNKNVLVSLKLTMNNARGKKSNTHFGLRLARIHLT